MNSDKEKLVATTQMELAFELVEKIETKVKSIESDDDRLQYLHEILGTLSEDLISERHFNITLEGISIDSVGVDNISPLIQEINRIRNQVACDRIKSILNTIRKREKDLQRQFNLIFELKNSLLVGSFDDTLTPESGQRKAIENQLDLILSEYKRFDIVGIKEDGTKPESKQDLTETYLAQVPNLTKSLEKLNKGLPLIQTYISHDEKIKKIKEDTELINKTFSEGYSKWKTENTRK